MPTVMRWPGVIKPGTVLNDIFAHEDMLPTLMPKLFNLRADPFEQADNHTMGYDRRLAEHFFLMVLAQEYVGKFIATFKEFPPSQKVGSFNLDAVMESLRKSLKGGS